MFTESNRLVALGARLHLDEIASESSPVRNRPRRRVGRVRSWALTAGLACLGSFMPVFAADDLGVWGGGGGGAGSASPYGGGGGAGKIIMAGTEYSGNAGASGDGIAGQGGEGTNKAVPSHPRVGSATLGDGGAGAGLQPSESGTDTILVLTGTFEAADVNIFGGGAGGGTDDSTGGGGGGYGGYSGGDGELAAGSGSTTAGMPGSGPPTAYREGGDGGAAIMMAETLRVSGNITVKSGTDGADLISADPGAAGGAARFTVNSLVATGGPAQQIVLSQDGGKLDVEIRRLTMANDLEIFLRNTTENDVFLGDLVYTSTNTTLNLTGAGSTINAKGNIRSMAGSRLELGGTANYNASNSTLTFILPVNVADGDIIFTVAGGGINIQNAAIAVVTSGDPASIGINDTIILLRGDSITGSASADSATITTSGSGTKRLILGISSDSTDLVATVLGITQAGVSASLAEGATSARMGLLYGRADTIATYTRSLSHEIEWAATGWTPFATVGAFDEKLKTGNGLDVRGYNFAAGMVKNWDFGTGRAFAGLAAEGGRGNYTTHINDAGIRYRGTGHTSYLGGTLLGRWEMPHLFNIDASFGLGRIRSDFRSAEYDGNTAYDEGTMYVAGHIGLDRIFRLGRGSEIQLHGGMLYTRQSSDSFTTRENEQVVLDAHISLRSSLGARYAVAMSDRLKVFTGAAWSYEFDGKTTARIDGERPSRLPNLGGHTGTGELGLTWRQRERGGWQGDVSVRGHIGKRKGVSGNILIGYGF